MKKLLLGILLVCLCFLLSSCRSKRDSDHSIEAPPIRNDSLKQETDLEQEYNVDDLDDVPIDEENYSAYLTDASAFSEGIAWVKYGTPLEEDQIGWLHTDGSIEQPDAIHDLSKFGGSLYDGYAYIGTGDAYMQGVSNEPDSFMFLNTKGEITAQSPEDGASYQALCGAEGIYLVKRSIRSMTENEDQYGIISAADGTWLLPCAPCKQGNGHPLSPPENPKAATYPFYYEREEHLNKGPEDTFCLRNGIFGLNYDDGTEKCTVLHNTLTGKTYSFEYAREPVIIYGRFYEGKTVLSRGNQMYVMTTDFDLNPITTSTIDTVTYSEGILFTANYHGSGTRSSYLTDAVFYRLDGSILADFSQYELVYEDAYSLYRFCDGYAAVIIYGADYNAYLAIIDQNGNFTFEPKQINTTGNIDLIGNFANGVIICQRGESADTKNVIINVKGEEIPCEALDSEYICGYKFCNGFAWLPDQQVFIGIDGEILQTFVQH